MIIKITYPYKDTPTTLETKTYYIQTDDPQLIEQLKTTKNPVDIGIILSQNENKYKMVKPQKEDLLIEIEEMVINPDLL